MRRPTLMCSLLLRLMLFDLFADLSLYAIEVEARWCLHGRKLYCRWGELAYRVLHHDANSRPRKSFI